MISRFPSQTTHPLTFSALADIRGQNTNVSALIFAPQRRHLFYGSRFIALRRKKRPAATSTDEICPFARDAPANLASLHFPGNPRRDIKLYYAPKIVISYLVGSTFAVELNVSHSHSGSAGSFQTDVIIHPALFGYFRI